jgi:4-amino-4-deoxy-L-arabinose transferase-like glycosyltransferase
MADETGSPRPKYPPPKPPSPTANPPQGGYPQQPGYGPGAVRAPAQPPAYWPLSIISFICSFLFGGIAMYFSAQVGSRWRAGNTAGAEKASKMALIWGIVGIAVGLIVFFSVIGSAESGY